MSEREEKIIYRIDDYISFRKCSLYEETDINKGDCTNFHTEEHNYTDWYYCNCEGIHFHCTKHPEIEFDEVVKVRGMDIVLVTTAKSNDEAFDLLSGLGIPFRK